MRKTAYSVVASLALLASPARAAASLATVAPFELAKQTAGSAPSNKAEGMQVTDPGATDGEEPERGIELRDVRGSRPIVGLAGHPDGVTIDLEQCADRSHLCVPVMLNGRGPFQFILDSGAALNVVTPETAARLGIPTEGKVMVQGTSDRASGGGLATVARTSLGGLTQEDQTFAVVAIGYPGVDGLLGFQWLRQAVTRIDWAARRLTFHDPATYVYRGAARPRTLDFHGNVPRVEARIDGHPGWFNLDTGDFAGVTVNPAFAHATGLDIRYTAGQETRYGGVGGSAQALLTQARLLEFGDARLEGPQLQLSRQTRDLLSAPGLAGNLGYGVLHRFDLVLDYAHRHVYFEANADTACSASCVAPAPAL